MDIARIVVTGGGITLIGFTLWFFFGGNQDAPIEATSGPVYACSMHPWITSSDPTANCSICGMKLVRQDVAMKHPATMETRGGANESHGNHSTQNHRHEL
ncbi:MAG: hypothetical protein JO316_12420 [Abitibacteriaceae bacterium]|nr:hypothetical protein [Abditibacteriaceae bacterium]MBV9866150.1 hypothetical protein [Abditibacteriaceae bacterium]